MDGNSSTTPTPGRRILPADFEAPRDAARQPTLIPLRSGRGVALMTATVLASMAGFLDASVVNVAVPAIARDLGTSLVALQWTLTGYLLTAAALLLVSGALADRYGRRRVLVIGLLVMLVASVGCAAAPSFAVLIAARIVLALRWSSPAALPCSTARCGCWIGRRVSASGRGLPRLEGC